MKQAPPPPVEERWKADSAGKQYRSGRWASARAEGRDPRMVGQLLSRFGDEIPNEHRRTILDIPCGTGRLQRRLAEEGSVTGVDISGSMLAAREAPRGLQASAWQLPFQDRSFGLVVSCRLLHHVDQDESRAKLLGELQRVSAGLLLASFWDAACWHALRRRAGWRRASHPDGRVAIPRARLAQDIEAAGGQVLGFAQSLRWISPQTWVAIRVSS